MRELQIFVPILPPAVLNPNRKAHWAVKAKAARDYAETVRLCAKNAMVLWARRYNPEEPWWPLGKAKVQLIFTFPLKQRGPLPDIDNLAASFKAGMDALTARGRGNGIVGAGIIEDDGPEHIVWFPTLIARGEDPGVRIIVQEGGE